MYHDYCITGAYISFFVLTSGRPLPVTTFFVFSKPLCSHFAAQIVIREFSAPLQKRCLSLSKGFPLQRETAKICYCCSQPFYSSFVALLEVILQRCSFRTGNVAKPDCDNQPAPKIWSENKFLDKSSGVMAGSLNMSNNKIAHLANPVFSVMDGMLKKV